MTRGGAMPSGTLESPLSKKVPRCTRTPRKRVLETVMFGYIYSFSSNAAAMHDLFSSSFEIMVAPPIS